MNVAMSYSENTEFLGNEELHSIATLLPTINQLHVVS